MQVVYKQVATKDQNEPYSHPVVESPRVQSTSWYKLHLILYFSVYQHLQPVHPLCVLHQPPPSFTHSNKNPKAINRVHFAIALKQRKSTSSKPAESIKQTSIQQWMHTCISDVQSVRLSRSNCTIRVLSL